jgi:hypothetical protein
MHALSAYVFWGMVGLIGVLFAAYEIALLYYG